MLIASFHDCSDDILDTDEESFRVSGRVGLPLHVNGTSCVPNDLFQCGRRNRQEPVTCRSGERIEVRLRDGQSGGYPFASNLLLCFNVEIPGHEGTIVRLDFDCRTGDGLEECSNEFLSDLTASEVDVEVRLVFTHVVRAACDSLPRTP